MRALFKVIFKDNETYDGGTLLDTKWLDMPHKEIKAICYSMPFGAYLTLCGADAYYHRVEALQDVMGRFKDPKLKILASYLYAKKGDKVLCYKIDQHENIGNIETKIYNEKDLEITQLNYIGWK